MTGIEITTDSTPKVLVAWSRKLSSGSTSAGDAVGTVTTVPDKLKIAGTFLVRVEADLGYKPVLTWSADQQASLSKHNIRVWLNDIDMGEIYYLRPRLSSSIDCSDCNS
jgi:Flp pilus assembly protein TadG